MISQTCLILPCSMPSPLRCEEKPPHVSPPALDALVETIPSAPPDRASPTTPAASTRRRQPDLRAARSLARPARRRVNTVPFIALVPPTRRGPGERQSQTPPQ